MVAVGEKFGRLTVLGPAPKRRTCRHWLCRCECGCEKEFNEYNMTRGYTRGCGCQGAVKHGMSESSIYSIWSGIKRRCYNESETSFKNYGGRGIAVCDRWRNSFDSFLTDMGPRPTSRHSIDRIDTNGNYEPENCRWATPEIQARNTRANRILEFAGESRCVAEWAEIKGIPLYTLFGRLRNGWCVSRALLLPSSRHRKKPYRPYRRKKS